MATDERSVESGDSKRGGRGCFVALALLVMYVLSPGPITVLLNRHQEMAQTLSDYYVLDILQIVWMPLIYLNANVPIVQDFYDKYFSMFSGI